LQAEIKTAKYPSWLEYLLIFLTPIVGMALGVAATFVVKINQSDCGNLVINHFFLAHASFSCFSLNFLPKIWD
jgi:membrane-anchored protein YejM (alkaline phosphatase superfamily)